jgi:hypothetical protein
LVPGVPGFRIVSVIEVGCETAGGGWACRATVTDDRGSSTYEVTVPAAGTLRSSLPPLPDAGHVERLVHETFAFLLEREPRSSILSSFDLTVVERYFPEYPAEILRRLAR